MWAQHEQQCFTALTCFLTMAKAWPQKGLSMANEKLTHIGPLPKVSRTHELQQLSLEALRAALPFDRFIIRDERI